MKCRNALPHLVLIGAIGLLAGGCLFKPTTVPVRHFVLSPVAVRRAPSSAVNLPIGVARVEMPRYLLRSSLAMRKDTHEIRYDEAALWAEPFDQNFQRTLAANLSALIPTDHIYLSAWEPGQVKISVAVAIEQFDVDTEGKGRLTAWWRIMLPGSEKPVASGKADLTRTGPPPRDNPGTMVITLSALTAELSKVLAEEIRRYAPSGNRPGT
jgi:uncharacterized protein